MKLDLTGLSGALVRRRQEEEGYNELPIETQRRLWRIAFEALQEPMVYLLLGCGAVYFFLGDQQEALMLLGFLALIFGITVIQEQKAERALEALRDLSSPRALVFRDGVKTRIAGREVVREDLILLNEGDRVPADARLLVADRIAADESFLTGESVPVEKSVNTSVFAGTTITRGQGVAQVTAVGLKTEIGKIGKSLQTTVRERTKLECDTDVLVRRSAWLAVVVCIAVFLIYAITREDWTGGILVALTLAMAILPNELPAVLAIFLSLGAWRISKRRVLTRKLPAVENLGAATVLCVDKTGTLTLNQMRVQKVFANSKYLDLTLDKNTAADIPEDFHEALEFGILARRRDPFDPTELAFLAAGSQFLQGTEHLHQDWELKKAYPLSDELLAISHAWRPRTGGGFVIGAKGASEAIIDLCHLSIDEAAKMNAVAETMAGEGLRVLGVAKAYSELAPLPEHQHAFEFRFIGFIGIADPLRQGVAKAVAECRSAGVRVVMMTGDHPATAANIARKIGLDHPERVLTGHQLEFMSEGELSAALKVNSVFSRVTPSQKLKLVELFKKQGEVVAMTGDGVNDAPALKSAHIGIAMGGRGTDVAREASSLVLLDDDFGSIVEAIRIGRRVFVNLRSALSYLLAVHVPIAGMSVLPVMFNMPLVLLPAHIALLHLIIEPASSIAFEIEPAHAGLMTEKPRDPKSSLFDRSLWFPSLTTGLCIFGSLVAVYFFALGRESSAGSEAALEARALVFTTLIITNIILILMSRSGQVSLFASLSLRRNPVAGWIAGGSVLLLVLVLFVPALRELYGFSFLHPVDLVLCTAIGGLAVLLPRTLVARLEKRAR